MTSRAGGRAGRRAEGFTLVEMLVVLVVLGVVLSVSVDAIASLRARSVDSIAERLGQAQRNAMATGYEVGVTLRDPRSGSARTWRFLTDGRAVGPGVDPRDGAVTDTTLFREVAP